MHCNKPGCEIKLRVVKSAPPAGGHGTVTYLACPFCGTYEISNGKYACGLKIVITLDSYSPTLPPIQVVEPCLRASDPEEMDSDELKAYIGKLL